MNGKMKGGEPSPTQEPTGIAQPLTPAWEDAAKGAVAAIEAAIEPKLRRAADELYADLLYSVKDYLLSNVLHNVQAQIDAAERQARRDRGALHEERQKGAALRSELRRILRVTLDGIENLQDRRVAMENIDLALAVIAKAGADQ